AWVLKHEAVTSAIIGATSAAQLADSLRGVELELDEEEMAECDGVWFDIPRARDPRIALR
ncbi:MAG TPA: aldo/keto reductase, partial [Blastocatellia bacterium]|nr:aldo/keto reductase [Blastocatellia bacterium]